ncbi:MAG: ArsR family transcriptional regulator [Alicyclobacillus sp.]|nr:ArsR family transcriptional regulator [Alicyclobacillus sp.]
MDRELEARLSVAGSRNVQTLRMGVVSADDSLHVIEAAAREFPHIRMVPIVYWREDEIIPLLCEAQLDVDMWLFSGQVPYSIVKDWGGIRQPMFYPPHTGEGLYRALLKLMNDLGLHLSEISLDTLQRAEVHRLLQEVGIDADVYVKPYTGQIDSGELVAFHLNLWTAGVTKAAVTCLRSAHVQLQRAGMPVLHVTATHTEICRVLDAATRTFEMMEPSQSAQIAAQVMAVVPPKYVREPGTASPTNERCAVDTPEVMAAVSTAVRRYTRRLQGAMWVVEPGKWMILTTIQMLEEFTQGFRMKPSLPEVDEFDSIGICCGMGVGGTVLEAEQNADIAFGHAKARMPGTWMAALPDKTIRGPLGHSDPVVTSYSGRTVETSNGEVPLSATTLSRISAAMSQYGTNALTTSDLARYLNIRPRSARRLLNILEAHGLATVVAEEAPHPRGRPRRVYQVNLDCVIE